MLPSKTNTMASFAEQTAFRSKLSFFVEGHPSEVPQQVTSKVTSVVGWLKQASLEVRAAGRKAVNTIAGTMDEKLVILHFNDVYNVESRASPEPVGGAARFCTAIKSFRHLNPLVLFSGDAFSPSMLSTFTKGEQMVPVLNEVGTHCAVLGNHDFDHGLQVLSQWVPKCNFPWLMSNVVDNETGRPLGEGRITHVVHWAGHQIGLVGLVEKEWLDTLATVNPEETTFLDFCEAGQKLSTQLKEEGCDYVIALTHMRTPNDKKLAENCDDIDLILGGHDHVYEIISVNGKYIIKSGTDFRQFSKIVVDFQNGSKKAPEVTIEEVNVTSGFQEDIRLKGILDEYTNIIETKMDDVLGCFAVPLDGQFKTVRTSESNLGNWVCDVVLAATGADLVILNSGTFRSDQVHPAGDFTMRDLTNIIPMREPIVVLKVTGTQILAALENSVSMYPKLEGRFPQVAGVNFAFDPNLPVGKRVDPTFIRIGDEYLQLDQEYRLATKSYLHTGRDGYTIFENAEVLVDEGECPELGMAIQNHFQAINMRLGKTKKHSKHRQSLVTLSRRHSLVKMLDVNEFDGPPPLRRSSTVEANTNSIQNHTTRITRRASLDDLEQESCQLIPTIDHRIVIINKEELELSGSVLQTSIAQQNRVSQKFDKIEKLVKTSKHLKTYLANTKNGEQFSLPLPPEQIQLQYLKALLEVRATGRKAVNTIAGTMAENVVILHFNDVYNVESGASPEPVGGAARFCTAMKSFRHLNPLVLFSGDVFSPSMLSTFTKGEQMVPVLNEVGTQCAVFGNHDFDHGLQVLSQLVPQCKFPWLMSNVVNNQTGRPLGEGRITHIIHWAGHQIGLVGLVEKEWLDTLSIVNPEETTFLDFCEVGQKLSIQLKEEGCDYVIALTHMRTPNDKKLAENCDGIDLILGGHDHVYEINSVNGKYIIKSGTDFRQFSKIVVDFQNGSRKAPQVTIEEVNITSGFQEDIRLKGILDEYTNIIEAKMDDVLGCFAVPLDGLFKTVRTSESNLGNWVCDIVLAATGADLVILNSGTFRSDRVHPAGDFTMRDLKNIIPRRQPIVVLKVTGNQILAALENSVLMYPKLEGRFPQVAGVNFAFDPNLPEGKRVDSTFIRIGDESLQLDQEYRLATKSYLHTGRDGYTMFKNAEVLVDEGECPEVGMAIQNHFLDIKMRRGKTKNHSEHTLSSVPRRRSLVKMLDVNEFNGQPPLRKSSTVDANTNSSSNQTLKITRRASFDDPEQDFFQLKPTIEHRIVILNKEEKRQELIPSRQ